MFSSAATLTVDLDALAHNYGVLRGLAGSARVAPVVKANAYGLGVDEVARRLHAEGVDTFYVARVAEGVGLRRWALGLERDAWIYVLDGCPDHEASNFLVVEALIPVLSSVEQVELWSREKGDDAALMIDTGLNRLGLRPEEALALAASPDRLRRVEVRGVLSHLACAEDAADPMNATQRARLLEAAAAFPQARVSLANSAGCLLEGFTLDEVRPGIALYGGGPRGIADARFRTVATLEAPVLQVRTVPRGETVGYGATFAAPETLRVAVVAAGYADGVLRAGSPGLYGFLDGRRLPVLGRISMDLLALDVSDCPAAQAGARVELLGPNVNLDEAAAACGTIGYELLARIGGRVQRRYVGARG